MCGPKCYGVGGSLAEQKEPPKSKVGFMYMLAGGTDASNTDPYAQKPEPNNNWVETGPHVMIVGAKGLVDAYPRNAKPKPRCRTSCGLIRPTST